MNTRSSDHPWLLNPNKWTNASPWNQNPSLCLQQVSRQGSFDRALTSKRPRLLPFPVCQWSMRLSLWHVPSTKWLAHNVLIYSFSTIRKTQHRFDLTSWRRWNMHHFCCLLFYLQSMRKRLNELILCGTFSWRLHGTPMIHHPNENTRSHL